MKEFWKMFLASILGFLTASVMMMCLAAFVFVGIITTLSSTQEKKDTHIPTDAIVYLDLTTIQEVKTDNGLNSFLSEDKSTTLTLTELISAIRYAAQNDKVQGLYLRGEIVSAGIASLSALRKALSEFKGSGKPIISYANIYTQKGYYLASVADKVCLNPQGAIELNGMYVSNVFYKNMLEKFGVDMQVFKVGTYKGAVEPFCLDKMSEPNREQITSFTTELWDTLIGSIATSRKVSVDTLRAFVDRGPLFLSPEDYQKANLVDQLCYEREMPKVLYDVDEENIIPIERIYRNMKKESLRGTDGTIQVLFAEGEITTGIEYGNITENLAKRLIDVAEDDDIHGVVLRVNSPGGSSYVSEQIWDAVRYTKSKKPIVISMGDYAASGGYYISCAADYIVAEPTTITGSIGIYGLFPNFSKAAQKIQLTEDGVKIGHFADFGNQFRPMNDDEKELMQQYIERGYHTFITRVADGRNLSKNRVDSIGQGRVWTGKQALERNLVDALGGLDFAIDKAVELARLETPYISYEDTHKNGLEELWKFYQSNTLGKAAAQAIFTEEELSLLQKMRSLRSLKGPQARLPYEVTF